MPLPNSMRQKLRRKAYGAIGSDMFIAEHMQETFKKVVGADVLKDAAKLKEPVLLIYGSKDTSTPQDMARCLKCNTSRKARIIEGAGHFVHQESEQKVAELIKGFLA